MSKFLMAATWGLLLLVVSTMPAAVFTQCPPVGSDTGCGILVTITGASGGAATAFTVVAASSPTQGPYEASEDTLIGVLNNSGVTVSSLALTSTTDIFGFDGDGPCTVSPNPGNCNPAETSGYGGPNVTFSAINSASTAGTVNFTGGLANGGSAWFGLEEALTASQLGGGGGVPEPASLALMSGGMAALLLALRRRKAV